MFTFEVRTSIPYVCIASERVYQMNWLFGLFGTSCTRFNQDDVFGSQTNWATSQQENFTKKPLENNEIPI